MTVRTQFAREQERVRNNEWLLRNAEFTPLMVAIVDHDVSGALGLIAEGKDLNAKNSVGRTALMLAASHNYDMVEAIQKSTRIEDIVIALVEKGVSLNERDNDGLTALGHARHSGTKDVVEILKRHGAEE